jgi:hypothetical protein
LQALNLATEVPLSTYDEISIELIEAVKKFQQEEIDLDALALISTKLEQHPMARTMKELNQDAFVASSFDTFEKAYFKIIQFLPSNMSRTAVELEAAGMH